MADYTHPSSNELLAALSDAESRAAVDAHTDDCLACRVRFARMQLASGVRPEQPSDNSVARILSASNPLSETFTRAIDAANGVAPHPNELWRVGRDEALLVWVRRVFDDGVADVVPVVFDDDLADEESVIIDSDATPLGISAAAMTALRTHIDVTAFLDYLCELDIALAVDEVIAATREGRRPRDVATGPPILDSRDQRLEYRQALRDLLGDLSPSAVASQTVHAELVAPAAQVAMSGEAAAIASDIGGRLTGITCVAPQELRVQIWPGVDLAAILKVVYLDTAVLVATLESAERTAFPGIGDIANACERLCHIECDADAVAVAVPANDWTTFLFTTADMRTAYAVPSGATSGPTVTMRGFDVGETLFKYLDAFAMTGWEFVEDDALTEMRADLAEVARRHVRSSIAEVIKAGSRAHQPKRQAWTTLGQDVEESVVRFVLSVASAESLPTALDTLTAEIDDA
ncbi:hypothetical protein [Mycobacterium deserti]|uniref:Zinc-finger domain-containing protein n=1 Tax=Mycobacterium deserti TaxID=2978347 RepID=A0ABT2MFE3_9MYCO|nr:hypothetical protein [Mycobacterium deserti]MCT7661007.1 hypothetical protein [Mycobacterium deserti]